MRDTTSSITRSIPSHGLNAGLIPPIDLSQKSRQPIISSNGYYGFHSINNTNGTTNNTSHQQVSEDCEMETDSTEVTPSVPNGINGSCNGKKNDSNLVSNGSSLDITMNIGVSKNVVPIGGRKRSREDSSMPEMKRVRREGKTIIFFLLIITLVWKQN